MKTICALIISVLIICSPAGAARAPYPDSDPAPKGRRIIEEVFPAHLAAAATSVAHCESRMDGNARNGKYLGLFQIGPREWAAHKPRPDANIFDRRDNAEAALSYWMESRSWKRWSCKP